MNTTILREGVLNDDVLYTVPEGYHFKGGYIAVVEYFTYATHWTDNRHIKRFKSVKTLEAWLDKQDYDVEGVAL